MRERGEPRLPPKIYRVLLVSFRRAKNESSSHRRGVCLGYPERGILSKIQEGRFRGIVIVGFRRLPTMYHAPRGKGFFLPWLTFHLWAGKKGFFV